MQLAGYPGALLGDGQARGRLLLTFQARGLAFEGVGSRLPRAHLLPNQPRRHQQQERACLARDIGHRAGAVAHHHCRGSAGEDGQREEPVARVDADGVGGDHDRGDSEVGRGAAEHCAHHAGAKHMQGIAAPPDQRQGRQQDERVKTLCAGETVLQERGDGQRQGQRHVGFAFP